MNTNPVFEKKEIGISILLSIVTCGIYLIIWCLSLARSAVHVKDENDQGTLEAVLMIFLPFIGLYMAEKKFFEGATSRSYQKEDKSIIYLVLGLVGLGIVGVAMMQDEINKFADAYENGSVGAVDPNMQSAGTFTSNTNAFTSTTNQTASASNEMQKIETIKKYKELFDSGAITQEEFDQVKDKLLNN